MLDAVSLRTPKYRHHKAKNLAVVSIRGRDIYLGRYGSPASRQEYRRIVAEHIETGAAPRSATTPKISMIEVISAYLTFANAYYRKAGKVTREYELIVECCRFIKPLYARRSAVEFGPLALKADRQKMIEANHSRKYINKNIERIRRMFKWAATKTLPNDPTGGTIGTAQYNNWRANFGKPPGSGSGSTVNAVPEPTALVLLMFAAVSWWPAGRRAHNTFQQLFDA